MASRDVGTITVTLEKLRALSLAMGVAGADAALALGAALNGVSPRSYTGGPVRAELYAAARSETREAARPPLRGIRLRA